MSRALRVLLAAAAGVLVPGLLALAWVVWRDASPPRAPVTPAVPTDAATLERGRVLALAGNCAACHTARGGPAYAGGRAIDTPFGRVVAGNLTPDPDTGLGRWTAEDFWHAMHHGRGRDGRRLLPVFPYTETTRMPREDTDALFAWLRTLPPVARAAEPHALRWPYGAQPALAVWRALYFEPGVFRADPTQSAEWNRGAYLVNGPGHCIACHGGRSALGGVADAGFGGGLIPGRQWVAPSLAKADEASVADWPLAEIVQLLQTGRAPRGQATGPMAEVVAGSTQHLPAAELQAMAVYLQSLPVQPPSPPATLREPEATALQVAAGRALYADHCAACHGVAGEGGALASGRRVVPPLAGNRLVTLDPPANLVRSIAHGGFGVVTAADPQPFGMPPYAHVLSEAQIADLATFLRRSWGAAASPVRASEVARWRAGGEAGD